MIDNLSSFLNTPLKIGNREIYKRAVLAPMAGINHIAFRELLASFGGFGILFTGMLNAKAVPMENRYKSNEFRWRDEEAEYVVPQLFGDDPETMAMAAKRIEEEGFFGVDLNFGCSVKKIASKNCGVTLMKDYDLCMKIVEKVRNKVDFPLFVKFRTGFEDNVEIPCRFANGFEKAGADALTFHPRVSPDRRSRPPKWSFIKEVQKSVKIPVFANGNIFSREDGIKVINQTGCQGISLGRIAIARPWIFAELTENKNFDYSIHKKTLETAARLFTQHYGEQYGIKLFKKFYLFFIANFKFGNKMSGQMINVENSLSKVMEKIEEIFEKEPEVSPSPNANLFTI